MDEVTSLRNPLVKRVRAVRLRKHRDQEGCFWAEGIRVALAALESGWEVEALVWSPELLSSATARDAIAQTRVRKVRTTAAVYRKLSSRENPQGLGALVRVRRTCIAELPVHPSTVVIALEEAHDPGNVGSVIRTADAAGAGGVVLLGNCADAFAPQAVRASMGSVFSVPVVGGVSVQRFSSWAGGEGVWLLGTSAGASVDYRQIGMRRPVALVFGSEQSGLSPELRGAMDEVVRIPLRGTATSLNLASAVAVMAFRHPLAP